MTGQFPGRELSKLPRNGARFHITKPVRGEEPTLTKYSLTSADKLYTKIRENTGTIRGQLDHQVVGEVDTTAPTEADVIRIVRYCDGGVLDGYSHILYDSPDTISLDTTRIEVPTLDSALAAKTIFIANIQSFLPGAES